jgi:hypothetical protein
MNRWAYATIVAIAVATLLAYFVRPKAPNLEFVSPRQELPEFEERLPGDTSLSQRVASSYGLALVLVQSPYTQENVIALDALRGWARQQFHTNPDFLHPLTLESDFSPHQTVIGSLLYNLTASVRYPLEGAVSQLVKVQIARFHETNAYHSIR